MKKLESAFGIVTERGIEDYLNGCRYNLKLVGFNAPL